MKIPFLDLKKIYNEQSSEIETAVQRVLKSGWYLLGAECAGFEKRMKLALVGDAAGHIVACNSGTDAIILSLLALDIGPGDEVITVSHTAIPTIAAIVAVGATPRFCEIHPDTWLMDCQKVLNLISERTKAIIPVHLYGNMVDVFSLKALLEKYGHTQIDIIEDCAQAQGSTLKGRAAGTIGRFGTYSFYPSKNLGALGDGGAVFCSSEKDAVKLRIVRFYWQESRYKAEVNRGINSRLNEIQAAILNLRLNCFDSWNERKRRFVEIYRNGLKNLPIKFQYVDSQCAPAWHLFVIQLNNFQQREALMKHLSKNGIETLVHYPIPTHRQNAFRSFQSSGLQVTEGIADRILSLPMNSGMNIEDVEYVIENIKSFYTST